MKKNEAKKYRPIELNFIEEHDVDNVHILKIEVNAEHEEVIRMLQHVCEECNLKPLREEWQSKYNHYVIFDYEPFCAKDGFIYSVSFEYDEITESKFGFVKTILGKWIQQVNKFNSLLEITI